MHKAMIAVTVSALASSAVAAPPALEWQATGKWTVEFADQQCLASRAFASGGEEIAIALRPRPATPRTTLYLRVPAATAAGWKKSKIEIGAEPIEASQFGFVMSAAGANRILSTNLTEAELTKLSGGASLSFDNGKRSARVTMLGLSGVRKILGDCVTDLLEKWGVSREQQANLQSFPETEKPVLDYVGFNDYPSDAVKREAGGEAEIRVLVGTDGVARECRLVSSSGDAQLDATTCAIFVRRARYRPARNKAGQAVEAPYVVSLRWVIP
ncbi:MAG: energy transducer TonB [Sphingomicrobium sp.]